MQRRGSVASVRLTLFLTTICASASANNTVIIQSAKCIETRPRFEKEVRLAVIAPADPRHEQSMPRILPAVLLAVKAVSSAKGLLPGWNITVDHRDSKCSSIQGPLAAFDFYINRTAGRSSLSFFHFPNFLEFSPVLFSPTRSLFRPIRIRAAFAKQLAPFNGCDLPLLVPLFYSMNSIPSRNLSSQTKV